MADLSSLAGLSPEDLAILQGFKEAGLTEQQVRDLNASASPQMLNTHGLMSQKAAFQAGYTQADLDTMKATADRNTAQREANPRTDERSLSLGGSPGELGGGTWTPNIFGTTEEEAAANKARQIQEQEQTRLNALFNPDLNQNFINSQFGGQRQTIDPIAATPPSGPALNQMPTPGWEGSINQDFYQKQFSDLLNQRQGEMTKEYAAAIRAQEAANQPAPAPTDPWAWAGGSQAMQPNVSTGAPNVIDTQYQLNPNYNLTADMSNQEMLQNLMPIFSNTEQTFLNKNRGYVDQGDWSTRQGVLDWASANPNPKDKGWTTVVNEIAQNVWTPGSTTTGPSAPPGYAYPVSGGTV